MTDYVMPDYSEFVKGVLGDTHPPESKLTPEERDQISKKYRLQREADEADRKAREARLQPVVDRMFADWLNEYRKLHPDLNLPEEFSFFYAPYVVEAKPSPE
jgi:hypothetical protein